MAQEEVNRVYEFLSNSKVTSDGILLGHIRETVRRCQQEAEVYVATDTTEFNFGQPREGLGRVTSGSGFMAHLALAISGTGKVLGVLGYDPWVRVASDPKKKVTKYERGKDPDRESTRWQRMVDSVEAHLKGSGVKATYLSDRESDDYPFIHSFVKHKRNCVLRVMHNRVLAPDQDGASGKLYPLMAGLSGVIIREVPISARAAERGRKKKRAPAALKTHPPREARTATLHFAATTVTIKRPTHRYAELDATITVNVVHVFEPDPPEGQPAVQWRLMTTLPVNTLQQIEAVVDAYRKRWVIEEYFKALKSGCQIEKRQLETGDALMKMTAFFLPLAYQLLLLRDQGRQNPDADARTVLSDTKIEVLRAMARKPLPEDLTVREAFLAIARQGGHLMRNGEPGWATLSKGFQRLLDDR